MRGIELAPSKLPKIGDPMSLGIKQSASRASSDRPGALSVRLTVVREHVLHSVRTAHDSPTPLVNYRQDLPRQKSSP
jgi:hypothetical protein